MNERLERVLDLPLHRFLGVTALESEQGRGALTVAVGENTANPAGMLHGGVIYTLCDVCAYAGLLSLIDADQEAVTHDLHVSIMKGVKPGETLQIRSEIARLGRSLCFIDVSARVGAELIATARVTKSLISLKR